MGLEFCRWSCCLLVSLEAVAVAEGGAGGGGGVDLSGGMSGMISEIMLLLVIRFLGLRESRVGW